MTTSSTSDSAAGDQSHGHASARDRGGHAPGTAALVRLHKVLARAGVASLRHSEQLILEGHVEVNGERVTTLGSCVDPEADVVSVDGRPVRMVGTHAYYLLNKPAGLLSAATDSRRRTVIDLFDEVADGRRLFPVGRLDLETEGLLLVTDDGTFAHLLMHPRYHVPKTYRARVRGVPSEATLQRLRDGVLLDDGPTAPAVARLVSSSNDGREAFVELTIREGRKRQVRRMFSYVKHSVIHLERIVYGPLALDDLPRGAFRELTDVEVMALRDAVGDVSGSGEPNEGGAR